MDFSPEREAGDRRTSKQRLRNLAYHQSPRIARAVAQNPNTHLSELIQLFYSYPDLVLRNPIFEENPAFLEQFCQELNLNIFSLSQPRSSFIQNWALNNSNRYIRQCFAASSTINEFYLEKLAADETVEVRLAVARNYKTPSNILEKLARDPAEIVCAAVAQNLTTSEAILNDLVGHDNIKVRLAVALNPLISDAIKQELSKDETEVKIALLNNPSINLEVCDRIYEAENEEIKIALARMKNLSNNLLEKLVKDENKSVRSALLKNPHIPSQILEQLKQSDLNLEETSQKDLIRQYYENKIETICDREIIYFQHFISKFPFDGRILGYLKIRANDLGFSGVKFQKISETVPETVVKSFERHLWYSQHNLSDVYLAKISANGIDSFALLIKGYFDDGWDNSCELIEIFDAQGNHLGSINLSQEFILENYENDKQIIWLDRLLDGSDYGHQDFFYPDDFPGVEIKTPENTMWSLSKIKNGYADRNRLVYSPNIDDYSDRFDDIVF